MTAFVTVTPQVVDARLFAHVFNQYMDRLEQVKAEHESLKDMARYFYAVYRDQPHFAEQLDFDTGERMMDLLERYDHPMNTRPDKKRMFSVKGANEFLQLLRVSIYSLRENEDKLGTRSDAAFFDVIRAMLDIKRTIIQ